MSSTRRAKPGTPIRQERYASSPEIERGLPAKLVSMRCSVLDNPKDRALIWFLQSVSRATGGLAKLASDLLKRHGDCIGSPSLRRFGMKPHQTYTAQQMRSIQSETGLCLRSKFSAENLLDDCAASECPNRYRLEDFFSSEQPANELPGLLEKICLDPASKIEGPWYFRGLPDFVRSYQAEQAAKLRSATVVTEIGTSIYEDLEYATASRCLVLIDGNARIGKTFAAKAWCEMNRGRARYIQVPSTSDDTGFFRTIAKALGIACGYSWKAVELRERIEDVLQTGDLLVVFDEAHYLWPVMNYRYALPGRINWVMTALANYNVPIALITTPQFIETQKVVEQRTNWTSEQFIGRIGHYKKLPDRLSEPDLQNVAKVLLPEGDERSITLLTRYAQSSRKYLAGIESAVRRARYLATKAGRDKVCRSDLATAIEESVIPSDTALADALAHSKQPRRARRPALQVPFKGAETPLEEESISDRNRISFSDREASLVPA